MLVGISPHAAELALTVPLGYVQKWNAEYAPGAPPLSSLVLEAKEGADVTRLTAAIRSAGYDVADSGAERAGLAITLVTLLFALVSVAMVSIAAINIAHSFFRTVAERRRELGVMRSVGASAGDIRALVLAEAAAIGLVRRRRRHRAGAPRRLRHRRRLAPLGPRFSVQARYLLRVRLDAACRRARMLHLGLHARRVPSGARRGSARADRSFDLVEA